MKNNLQRNFVLTDNKELRDRLIQIIGYNNYERNLELRFNFLIEKELNYGNYLAEGHYISGENVNISMNAHIEYNYFHKLSVEQILDLQTAYCVKLLKHWKKHYETPKNLQIDNLIEDVENYVKQLTNLPENSEKAFIKPEKYFKFSMVTTIYEGMKYKYNCDKIRRIIANNTALEDFGVSINDIMISHNIVTGNYYEKISEYGARNKNAFFILSLDYDTLSEFDFEGQVRFLENSILERTDALKLNKMKPKDFDYEKFKILVKKSINEYLLNNEEEALV
jgi:hypothetical protein